MPPAPNDFSPDNRPPQIAQISETHLTAPVADNIVSVEWYLSTPSCVGSRNPADSEARSRRVRSSPSAPLESMNVTEEEVLQQAEDAVGYRFKDRSILLTALTHASIANSRLESNERMEFFGDAILGLVVCKELFAKYPDLLEGEMTKIKSAVVSRQTCAILAKRLGLHEMLFLGKGMTGRSELPSSLAAAAFESIIAAIYMDSGDLTIVEDFILRQMGDVIAESAASQHQRNYKSQLQQHAQRNVGHTPMYELLDEQGPDHSKCFEVCVVMGGRRFPSAWGPSKKEAEQKAAYQALRELELVAEECASE